MELGTRLSAHQLLRNTACTKRGEASVPPRAPCDRSHKRHRKPNGRYLVAAFVIALAAPFPPRHREARRRNRWPTDWLAGNQQDGRLARAGHLLATDDERKCGAIERGLCT